MKGINITDLSAISYYAVLGIYVSYNREGLFFFNLACSNQNSLAREFTLALSNRKKYLFKIAIAITYPDKGNVITSYKDHYKNYLLI